MLPGVFCPGKLAVSGAIPSIRRGQKSRRKKRESFFIKDKMAKTGGKLIW